jgi:hypothetical protein
MQQWLFDVHLDRLLEGFQLVAMMMVGNLQIYLLCIAYMNVAA